MEHVIEKITPATAEKYLNRNHGNRALRDGLVERYANDMRNGTWTQCVAPIAFYDNGDIADGQHRLWAVVESDAPQKFIVVRGLPREAGLNIDTGKNRSIVDNAKIAGVREDLTAEVLSVARSIEFGTPMHGVANSRSFTDAQRIGWVDKHIEVLRWVLTNGPRGKGMRNSLTMGAVARAWYHEENKDKLRRYCDVFCTGFGDGESESPAIAFRNYVIAKGVATTSSALWRDSFLKCQNSIKYFMMGKPLTNIRTVADEPYPLKKVRVQR
jgi:hypothetical protein